MAKSAAAETGQEVATAQATAGLPAGMDNFDVSELEGLSGLGYSEKAEDSLVPIISILQDNSGVTGSRIVRAVFLISFLPPLAALCSVVPWVP